MDREPAEGAVAKAQRTLKGKLKAMENKLIQGGKMLDEAARQEAELRRTEAELEEAYRRYKTELSRVFEKHKHALLPPDVAARGLLFHRL